MVNARCFRINWEKLPHAFNYILNKADMLEKGFLPKNWTEPLGRRGEDGESIVDFNVAYMCNSGNTKGLKGLLKGR